MANNLKKLRVRGSLSQDALAEAMGTTRNQLTKLESGKRRLTDSWIERAAKALGVSPGDLVNDLDRTIPIVGMAGAGPDGSILFATGDSHFGEYPAPPNSTEHTKALEVKGGSMHGIANDGYIITYDERVSPTPDMENEPCVVWLEDERVLVKILHFGRADGLFDLESTNAPLMRDVRVLLAALVTNIVPRRAAQRFIHRNKDAHVVDVTLDGQVVRPGGRALQL